jgi:hypothetical protein
VVRPQAAWPLGRVRVVLVAGEGVDRRLQHGMVRRGEELASANEWRCKTSLITPSVKTGDFARSSGLEGPRRRGETRGCQPSWLLQGEIGLKKQKNRVASATPRGGRPRMGWLKKLFYYFMILFYIYF